MANLRTARTQDVSAVAALQRLWEQEENTHGFGAATEAQIASYLGEYFLVAEDEGAVLGFGYGTTQVSEGTAVIPAGAKVFEVADIYVHPNHRSSGLGGQMLEELLAHARAAGCEYSLLYSSVKDLGSIVRFYRRHGFETWYVQMFRRMAEPSEDSKIEAG